MRKNALTRAMGIMTAAAALLCAAGCEIIGLGAAVDAAPPAIYISTPTVNQAVSSTFDITGTCTDDTGVREIRIQELRHNDDPNISYKDLGKISPNSDGGTWGITLEHNGDFSYTFNGRQMDLPDGTYIIETTANDGSRDSSNPAARAFDIDNTPPIFLVSSPNSIEGSVGKSYGREIAITGTIADGHDITKMRVKAYDNDGNEISLAKSEFNVPDKALVSVILAKYDAVTEEAYESLDPDAKILQQNYMRLFGRTENVFTEPISTVGYANVSIAIELEDKAGNKSERTFLSDGLTSLARANAGLDESTIIDSATYMYILNGNNTVSVPLSDAGKAVVRNALLGIGDNDTYKFMSYDGETNHKRLIMKINPDNSPTYKVSGYAIDAENTKWKDLPNEAQITLEIKSGRDGYTFKPSELKVCIYEEDGNGGLTKDPSFLKWFYDKDNRYDKFMESGDSIRGLASTTQGTYQIILPGSDESPFVQNKRYYLVVEGKDANDNAMVPENGAYYGFKIMESGKAPWLECEDAGKYRKLSNILSSGNTDSKLTVTIYDQEKKITSYNGPDIITYDVEWFEGHYESVSELPERTPVLRSLGNPIGKNGIAPVSQTQYSVQIPLGSPASTSATNYTIKVSVTANNGAASSNKTSYLVYADGKAPVVTLENPELESSGSKKINSDTSGHIVETDPATGNVSHFYELRGKVKDVDGSGVYRIYVSYNGSRYEVTDTPQVTAETGWRYKLPVVERTDQTIRIEAVDKNENNVLGDPVTGITMDFEPPVVGLVSIKEGDGAPNPITNVADIAEYYNQKPITVRVGITDSIGVAENGISILTYRDDTRINDNFYVETSVATDRSYEDIKLKTDGKWKVVVQATDMAGAKSKEFTFELMIDTTKPVINNDAAVEGLTSGYTSSDVVRISGTANEQGSGLSKVEYKLTDSNGTTSPDWIPSAATGTGANATFNLSGSGLTTAKGGHNTIQVRLVDKAGNPSEPKTFEVNVDNAAPVITSEYYKSGSGAREEIP
ncbi:MAG: Ig-like domain repeat protein, partial [Treponema sp.]|nr:Ig-like domain repeat protein [Treponema sp.]